MLGVSLNKRAFVIQNAYLAMHRTMSCTSWLRKPQKKEVEKGEMILTDKKVIITFRLNKDEEKRLRELAKEYNMTESAYIRMLISQKPNDYPEIRVLLKSLINEVNHIGVNVNQIVKSYNSGFYNESDKGRLTAYMKKLNNTVNEAVKSIGNQ